MKSFDIKRLMWIYIKEIRRMFAVPNQTIIGPIINTIMFAAVFYMLGKTDLTFDEKRYKFVILGMTISTIFTSSFANSSSSIGAAKVIGYISDLLIPPLTSAEIILAHILASITRSSIIVFAVYLLAISITPIYIHNLGLFSFYTLSGMIMLCLSGILTGICCSSFEQINCFTSYLITPLSLFSGNFFSLKTIPYIRTIVKFNPLYYIVEGIQHSFGYQNDLNLNHGAIYVIFVNSALLFITYFILKKGWRLKS